MINDLGENSIFCFGGPSNWKNKDKVVKKIIDQTIIDDNFIHTCLDYNGHIEFIKEAAIRNKKKLKLIVKCYLNYPSILSIRRETIFSQIERIRNLFREVELDLVIQISSISSTRGISNKSIEKFVKLIHKKFEIKGLIFETFPDGEKIIMKIVNSFIKVIKNLNYQNKIFLGITSYENTKIYGFSNLLRNFIVKHNLVFVPMRVIGSSKNKFNIERSKIKLKKELKIMKYFLGITQVSSIEQYLDLKNFSNKNIDRNSKIKHDRKLIDINILSREKAIITYGINYKFNLKKFILFLIYRLKEIFILMIQVLGRKKKLSLMKNMFSKNLI